jgi:hypothetical protein
MDRSTLRLTLGDVLDRHGAWDAAFTHYSEGNGLRKQWLEQTGQAFDPAAHSRLVDLLIATFDRAYFDQRRHFGTYSEVPVFVVGMPRSGTTLIMHILSSHSQVAGPGELKDMAHFVTDLGKNGALRGGYPRGMPFVQESQVRSMAERYLRRLAKLGGPATRVVDKMPDNFLCLGLIALLFPGARVIHCRRDPLDVCLSCYFQNFQMASYSHSLEDLGRYHRDYQRLMRHWQRILPLRMLDVRYEDVVGRQEKMSRELVEFCGLEWQDRCLAFHQNAQPVGTASVLQVRKPIYSHSIGRWKNYASHLEPLRRALELDGRQAAETAAASDRAQAKTPSAWQNASATPPH